MWFVGDLIIPEGAVDLNMCGNAIINVPLR